MDDTKMDSSNTSLQNSAICFYYVDEAGDPTIFGSKHKIMLGQEGVSRYFILGLLHVKEPSSLTVELSDLRHHLIADPYFKGVPSMQPEADKTAVYFHAKDDVPEIRKEVFQFLQKRTDLRFFAAIKDKNEVLKYVLERNKIHVDYRYTQNELYDFLVRRLFKERLHQQDSYEIIFAKRQKSDRTKALYTAIEAARTRFSEDNKLNRDVEINISSKFSKESAGLQVADYFLWALQRFYTNREDRFLNLLWPSFRLVIDMDDHRISNAGKYYNPKDPLALDKIPPLK
jgi:hypothetical protein